MIPLKSPPLSEVQRWMRWTLTRPEGVENIITETGVRPVPKSVPWTRGKEPTRCLHVIGETKELSRVKRLSIYGEGYFLRLIDCLGANFECVKNVLGEEVFSDVARRYLVEHPSTSKCIDDAGSRMAEFLIRHPLLKRFPFLPELASLEWAYHEAFYTDDAPQFDASALAQRAPEEWHNAKILLDKSVRLLTFRWPVDKLWRNDGKWTDRRLKKIKKHHTNIAVFRRPDGTVRVATPPEAAFGILKAFQSGKSFGAAFAALGRTPIPPKKIHQWFGEWVQLGIIRDVRF